MRLKDFGEIRKSLLNTLEWIQGIATGRSRLITQEGFLHYYYVLHIRIMCAHSGINPALF